MSGHSNTKGNIGFLKSQYNQNKAMGEKAKAFEFKMTVKGYPNLSILCRSTQMPAMGRSDMEDYGAMGMLFVQQGALENSGEITVTLIETIKGHALADLRNIIRNAEYVDINVSMTPESLGGKGVAVHSVDMLDCKIRCDVIELSSEDTSAAVKPSLTIRYNFIDI